MTIRRHAHTYVTLKGVSAPCVNTLRQHTARVLHVASGSKPPRHVLSRCQSSQSRPELASHHLAPLVSSELTRRRRSLLMAAVPSLPRLSPFRSACFGDERAHEASCRPSTQQVAGLPRPRSRLCRRLRVRSRPCSRPWPPPAARRSPLTARRPPLTARRPHLRRRSRPLLKGRSAASAIPSTAPRALLGAIDRASRLTSAPFDERQNAAQPHNHKVDARCSREFSTVPVVHSAA